ncbi:uncharacterized protein KD926_007101 [Aspergillus affinis]|uniref:uncharacterized protein n=1 Tax=Aspergillus affinis TaxID=1070780 RepID=UPI0022FEA8B4|nr:uncharacterized protein KD926_007101 [Aspergillus affinis]KAI9045798.1 hypothetical protein KD926_007101 [Aspergillus affinis]
MGDRLQLENHERAFLCNQLLLIPHRTYLWVTLIFDVIENSISYTNAKVQEIMHTLPRTVDEAYERILDRSPDRAKAQRLLHIVVAAVRPMTLKEMRIALAVGPTHLSYLGLDLRVKALVGTKGQGLGDKGFDGEDTLFYGSALTLAAKNGHERVVNVLLDAGAGGKPSYFRGGSYQPLEQAAANGHVRIVEILLDREKRHLDTADSSMSIALRHAAADGHEEVVRLVLAAGANAEGDSQNESPLLSAATQGHVGIVKLLLKQRGIDPMQRSATGSTPLILAAAGGHDAATGGHMEVVKLLIATNAVHLDVKDSSTSRTPLLWSLAAGHESISKLLLESGAQDIESIDCLSIDRTALSIAAELGNETLVDLLLGRGKAYPNSRSAYNRTPLSYASESGWASIVKKLLDTEDVDSDLADTYYGRTPLSWAAANSHLEVVRLLLHSTAVDASSRDTMYGRTPCA